MLELFVIDCLVGSLESKAVLGLGWEGTVYQQIVTQIGRLRNNWTLH